ncbi:MAG: hypothetical protein ACPGRE_06095 [Flavobacteriaceae bacterium]
MKNLGFILLFVLATLSTYAQQNPASYQNTNSANRLISSGINGVTVGGYAQIDYNQPLDGSNGKADVHRLVMLFGYNFSQDVQFVTEIEFEHVTEVYVEQAFLNYNLTSFLSFRGGLMLVPMGIINEYHEPTTYNGVERPNVDKSIVPTTWREMGFGVTGNISDLSLRYQGYLFNGFASDNNGKYLGGSNGLRNGRQKGAEAMVGKPNFSTKFDYYGIQGLKLGLSGYFGSSVADNEVKDEDGSTVGISMLGLDARYVYSKFSARAQYIKTYISGAEAYNEFYGSDLGDQMEGWYVEGAYNVLPANKTQELTFFMRYEQYNTQQVTSGDLQPNLAYDRMDLTTGVGYLVARGAVIKADYQRFMNGVPDSEAKGQMNFGIGVWF